jgi:hypothetical protein
VGAGGVAEGIGPEFKSQYCKTKQKKIHTVSEVLKGSALETLWIPKPRPHVEQKLNLFLKIKLQQNKVSMSENQGFKKKKTTEPGGSTWLWSQHAGSWGRKITSSVVKNNRNSNSSANKRRYWQVGLHETTRSAEQRKQPPNGRDSLQNERKSLPATRLTRD